jgi:hypothetical protein
LELAVTADGEVDGTITWTLRRDATGDQSRIGESAVESVRGYYSPSLSALSVQGYAASDESLIGLDTYRLVIADDGSRMVGITWANGAWDGRVEFIPQGGV